jgi:hypothetical protein
MAYVGAREGGCREVNGKRVVNLGTEPRYILGDIPRHLLNTTLWGCVRVCVCVGVNLDPVQYVKYVPGIP